ncbi:hypothetical protein LY78DRAFT_367334 [Colletotrichum sublineola]|nr:hypothetical protein LY78DRAFT_367334 [Colletotrichum sublineola]
MREGMLISFDAHNMVLHNDNSEEANAIDIVDDRTIDTLVLAQATCGPKSTKQIVDATATRPLGSEGPALPVTVLVRLDSAIATVRGFQDGAWLSVSGIRTLSAGPLRESLCLLRAMKALAPLTPMVRVSITLDMRLAPDLSEGRFPPGLGDDLA